MSKYVLDEVSIMTVLLLWHEGVAATNRQRRLLSGFVRLRAGERQGPEQCARRGEDIQLRRAERDPPIGARVGRHDGKSRTLFLKEKRGNEDSRRGCAVLVRRGRPKSL